MLQNWDDRDSRVSSAGKTDWVSWTVVVLGVVMKSFSLYMENELTIKKSFLIIRQYVGI